MKAHVQMLGAMSAWDALKFQARHLIDLDAEVEEAELAHLDAVYDSTGDLEVACKTIVDLWEAIGVVQDSILLLARMAAESEIR